MRGEGLTRSRAAEWAWTLVAAAAVAFAVVRLAGLSGGAAIVVWPAVASVAVALGVVRRLQQARRDRSRE